MMAYEIDGIIFMSYFFHLRYWSELFKSKNNLIKKKTYYKVKQVYRQKTNLNLSINHFNINIK